MSIKNNFKSIISALTMGLFAKAQALAAIGMNVFQMGKLALQIKKNVKVMTRYMKAIKNVKEELDVDEMQALGKKCADAGLMTPGECFTEFGDDPEESDDSDDDETDFGGILGKAQGMFGNAKKDQPDMSALKKKAKEMSEGKKADGGDNGDYDSDQTDEMAGLEKEKPKPKPAAEEGEPMFGGEEAG
jgi:hypothetical protein